MHEIFLRDELVFADIYWYNTIIPGTHYFSKGRGI